MGIEKQEARLENGNKKGEIRGMKRRESRIESQESGFKNREAALSSRVSSGCFSFVCLCLFQQKRCMLLSKSGNFDQFRHVGFTRRVFLLHKFDNCGLADCLIICSFAFIGVFVRFVFVAHLCFHCLRSHVPNYFYQFILCFWALGSLQAFRRDMDVCPALALSMGVYLSHAHTHTHTHLYIYIVYTCVWLLRASASLWLLIHI